MALAFEHGQVELQAPITVRIEERGRRVRVPTTVGRVLLARALDGQPSFNRLNRTLDRLAVSELLTSVFHGSGARGATGLAERLWRWGWSHATSAGVSIGARDARPPAVRAQLIAEAERECAELHRQYEEGVVTDGERYNKVIDVWSEAAAKLARVLQDSLGTGGPLEDLEASGAGVSTEDRVRLRGGVEVTQNWRGAYREEPIRPSLAEGFSAHEAFMSASSGRRTLTDALAWSQRARALQRSLVAAMGPVRSSLPDCGTRRGLPVAALVVENQVRMEVVARILGRTAAADVWSPDGQQRLVREGAVIDAATAERLARWGHYRVRVRSVLTCEAAQGVCARCHGAGPDRELPPPGAMVGLHAAQVLRTVEQPVAPIRIWIGSVCGVAPFFRRGREVSTPGVVHFENIQTEHRESLDWQEPGRFPVMVNAEGRLSIRDEGGTERESFRVRHGDRIDCEDGQRVRPGDCLVRNPAVREAPPEGTEGLGAATSWALMPMYPNGVDAEVLEALLSARQVPAWQRADFAEVDGQVRLERGKVVLSPVAGGPPRVHPRHPWKHLSVYDGEHIQAGSLLMDGETTLHDVLRILGREVAAHRLLSYLEAFFERARVPLRPVHLELLVRELLGRVRIQDGGGTELLPGEQVPEQVARRLSARAVERGGQGARWRPVFTGLRALVHEGGPLHEALSGEAVEAWARAALRGEGDALTSPTVRALLGLGSP